MLGVALLGCGRITVCYAQLLSSGEIAGAKLVAVCDINKTCLGYRE